MANPQNLPELDVRTLRKPERHPRIFARFHELAVGESFLLLNDHEPINLLREFEAELGGAVTWEYLSAVPEDFQIKITKLTSTPLPRLVTNSHQAQADPNHLDPTGAIWRLNVKERDLDSHIVELAPGQEIPFHNGPDMDILFHFISGSGVLGTEAAEIAVNPGDIMWLPRRAKRSLRASDAGLRYLTVHQRRQMLTLNS